MRYLFLLLTVFCFNGAYAQDGVRDDDNLLDRSALKSLLSGQILEFYDGSKSRYGADGTYGYTYNDDGPVWSGQYSLNDNSQVCTDFDNGSSRCDLIVMNKENAVLITANGVRFPIRKIFVDGK